MIELAKPRNTGKRCRVGQLIAVTFMDHSEDHDEPILFTVYGRVSKNARGHICIDCWEYANQDEPYDDNEKRFTIVKRAIQHLEVLKDCPAKPCRKSCHTTPNKPDK